MQKSETCTDAEAPGVLAIDVGGCHVKVMHSIRRERRAFDSGPALTAERMCREVGALTQDWDYARIAIGIPCPVRDHVPLSDPPNLAPGWVGFDYATALGKPVRILNDAAMQALGSYRSGKMLFIGLGTGLGTALVLDGKVIGMELGHLPYRKNRSLEDYVGERGLQRLGPARWRKHVQRVIALLDAAFVPDEIVIGGGNVRLLEELPPGCRRGDNDNAFLGGFRLWQEES